MVVSPNANHVSANGPDVAPGTPEPLNLRVRPRDQRTSVGCAAERVMTLDLRKTAWLGAGLFLVLAGLLAAARGFAPDIEHWLEKIRAGQAISAEAALRQQGGSRILLKVDADALREAILTGLRDDVRRVLREERIPLGGFAARDGSVEVRIREAKDRERTLNALAAVAGASSGGHVEIVPSGEELIRVTPTEAGFAERLRALRQQAIEVIEQRLGSLGVAVSGVQKDGDERIRVLLPGISDPERLGAIFDKRSRITFRLVDLTMTAGAALQGKPPAGAEVLYELNSKIPHLLAKQVAIDGGEIADAAPGFDQQTRAPIVTFRFNAAGTRRFARVTQENIGRPFAVVLDDEVIAVPIIREPILGGSGQISGSFTLEDANRIAMAMRSGALPGHLVVVEQQVVEPEGQPAKQ
jgi:preprotein translocase subunit SecD